MGQHTKTIETFSTETRQQGQQENIRTADSYLSTKNMQPNLENLTRQAREDLHALQTKKVSEEGLSAEEAQRLNALRLGQQNVSYLKGSYGEQAMSNRAPDGTIHEKYITTKAVNNNGVNRMQIESERVVIDPAGTFSKQGKKTYSPTTQEVGKAGL